MSQSLLQTSSLVSVSSSSSSSQISGFIQCISQQFRVKSEYTVLIKITSNVDCFCQPVYHVLVNWPIVDHCDFSSTKDKCIEFLNKCRLRSWIRIFKLKKSRIYHKQNRENKVWVFIPDETFYESYYYNDTTMPSCYSPKCLSSHIGLIPSMNFHIIRVHTNGMFIELKCINYHLSQQYYLLFNNFQALQSTKMLMNTDYIKLSNIWCFNINYHAVDDECTKLYAILIPGIYSTVANNSHYSLKSIRSFGKPIQCYGECCNEGRQFDGNNFLLLLHDLHYLAYISMECQITGLHNEPMHFKVNTSGKQECTMPDLYQRVLSAIYKRVLNTKYTIYQYTEDFIQFPFIPSELQCNQFYCLMIKNFFNLVNIISILERVKILKRLNNESKQLYKFITSNQSVECIQCIRFGQMPTTTTTTPSSVKYTSTTNYSRFDYQHIWNVEIYNTRLLLKLGCEIVENSYLLIRISYSDPLPESFLIGQIVWCNTQGCFHFQSVQRNTLSIPFHVTADDNFISLPLIFDVMNGSDEIHPFVIPSNYSLVILKDVRLIYEEYPSSSIETMTSSNGSDICYAKSSSSSSCSCSQMYIYAKEIIPLQINYTPEKVKYKLKEKQSMSFVLISLSRLFSSTTISSNDNFDPSIKLNPSQKLLWSYKFVGKPIDTTDNTISSSSSITDTKLSNHQYTPNSHSELIHLSLIGDLAYRWYYTFRIGGQYHLTWYKVSSSSSTSHSQYEQLIHVSTINQSNSFNEIYSSHSFINLYDILLNNQSSNCSMINSQFNFQVIILFKYYRIPYNDWILWVTDSISQSSNVIIKTECTYQLNNIYKIRLCNDEKSNNNMKLLLMNLSKVVLCKFINFTLFSITYPSSESLMYLQFHCNALSWIVVDNKHSIDSMLKKNRIDTHLLNNSIPMNILPSEENNNNENNNNNNNHDETLTTTTTTTKHLSIVNNFDWICIDDICKECISVQATITRCLEFQVYRLPYTNGGIVNGDENFIDLGICIRFTISDGSGSALVQLGNPPCLSSSRSTTSTAPPQIPSTDNLSKTIDNSSIPLKNDYSNVNYSHNNYNDLELARLLLGFNPSLWKRLCSKLKYMLNQGIDVSISLYDIMNNDITTSYEKNNTSFGISSTFSTSMNLSSDRLKPKNNFISIQLALKMYLNSPTFLRNCRFNLKRRMITSRNCCPSKMTTTTTTTIPSSSSEYWRLKRVNLKKENNFLSLNNKYEHEQQSVYFVLPPYKLYTLLNVISHNDDFVFQ